MTIRLSKELRRLIQQHRAALQRQAPYTKVTEADAARDLIEVGLRHAKVENSSSPKK